jgi:hypothetical protein
MQFKSLARAKHMGFLEGKGRISVHGISKYDYQMDINVEERVTDCGLSRSILLHRGACSVRRAAVWGRCSQSVSQPVSQFVFCPLQLQHATCRSLSTRLCLWDETRVVNHNNSQISVSQPVL